MLQNHEHTYDAQGRMTCCTLEDKIYTKADAKDLIGRQHAKAQHQHEHSDDDGHDHSGSSSSMKMFLPSIVSLVLLLVAIYFDNALKPDWFAGWVRIFWYIAAYIPCLLYTSRCV